MQQEPIINHGTLIDTYNYAAIIRSHANTTTYNKVIKSRPSKKFQRKNKKHNNKPKSRVLKNTTHNK